MCNSYVNIKEKYGMKSDFTDCKKILNSKECTSSVPDEIK